MSKEELISASWRQDSYITDTKDKATAHFSFHTVRQRNDLNSAMLKLILLLVFPFIHTVSAMTPLLEAESLSEPSWLNLNTTRVPAIPHPGQTVTVVTYGLDNYFHSLMTPQFTCRYTSKGDRGLIVNTDYARLRQLEEEPCLVIDCPLKSVESWKFNERTALVSVHFRKKTGLKFVGIEGANEISFISEWTSFEYDTFKAILVIYGISLDPEYDHTVILTLDNGKKFTACARPKTLNKIVYNLKDDVQTLDEEQPAKITIETVQGVIVYGGDKGGDSVIIEPFLHAACDPDNHKVVDQPWRKVSNTVTRPRYCDQRSVGIQTNGWNRIDPKIGGNLPRSCPSYNRCGTYSPGWLRDALPTEKGIETANTVCFRWGCYCCNYKTSIKVINCGEFYVYYLPPPPRCDMAYCSSP